MFTSEAVDFYLSAMGAKGLSKRTLDQYSSVLYRFIKVTGDLDTAHLSRFLVTEYCQRVVTDETLSAATKATYIRPVKSFLRWMFDERLISEPIRVTVPPVRFKLKDLLTGEDVRRLLDVCDLDTVLGRRDYAIVCFLLDTGVRMSELTGLRTDDVNMKLRQAKVLGKGAKERMVFYSAPTAVALVRYRQRLSDKMRGEWFFPTRDGRHMGEFCLNQILKKRARQAGVTARVNPHTFRHTFATDYLRAGGDLNSLQRLMGHADLTILMNYLSLVDADLREKHDQFSPLTRALKKW
jgi:integrase/recombinase XerD